MRILYVIVLVSALSCSSEKEKVKVIKYGDLESIIDSKDSDLLVVNFWATWCAPCVKELHQFEDLREEYAGNDLSVVLVSFDFPNQLDKKVIPFVEDRNIKSEVVLLDETDYNSFIDKIDPSWSGAIPATLMLDNRKGTRRFFEKEFKEGELKNTFEEFTTINQSI